MHLEMAWLPTGVERERFRRSWSTSCSCIAAVDTRHHAVEQVW